MSNQSTKNNDMNDDGMLNAETQRKLPQGKILQPKLRFKGFTDPWQQRKLGELANITSGKSVISNQSHGAYAVLGSRGIIGHDDSYDYQGSFILIARVGAHAGHMYHYVGKVKISDNTIFLTSQMISFLYCRLLAFNLKQLSFGTGQPLIKANELKSLLLTVPPTSSEQERIVGFFCVLDDLIAAAKKKADLLKLKKKYYLQAIFSQRLRFKGFTKPWQQRKLEELCIRVGSGGTPSVQHPEYYNGKIPFLGISNLSGRAVSATQKKITQRGLDNSAAWLVPKGSITLAMYASVGKVAILDIELATSQAFFNMVIPEETCIRDFLFSRLEKADICHEWLPLISTGTQPNLNAAKLKDWELKVPSTQERKTIGEFFHALDDLAAALARKIELLERRKTAYLQRLFV